MITIRTKCPTCGALEIQDDFPTANQGPTTSKYECGSEWYDDFELYSCGHKPLELPKINKNSEFYKKIQETLSKLSVYYRI